jgi:hypothetical protein
VRVLLLTQWFEPEPAFKGLGFAKELIKSKISFKAANPSLRQEIIEYIDRA